MLVLVMIALKIVNIIEKNYGSSSERSFLSRLSKQEDSLISCASDFLPITIFVSIRRVFTNVYLQYFK